MNRLSDFHNHLASVLGIPAETFSISLHKGNRIEVDQGDFSASQLATLEAERRQFDFGGKTKAARKAEALDVLFEATKDMSMADLKAALAQPSKKL